MSNDKAADFGSSGGPDAIDSTSTLIHSIMTGNTTKGQNMQLSPMDSSVSLSGGSVGFVDTPAGATVGCSQLQSPIASVSNDASHEADLASAAAVALGAVPVHMIPAIQGRLKKTKVCKHYLRGNCNYGSHCSFAHTLGELQMRPDLRKTKLCSRPKGQCNRAGCAYAHNLEELHQALNDTALYRDLQSNGAHLLHKHQAHHAEQAALLKNHMRLAPGSWPPGYGDSPPCRTPQLSTQTTDECKVGDTELINALLAIAGAQMPDMQNTDRIREAYQNDAPSQEPFL